MDLDPIEGVMRYSHHSLWSPHQPGGTAPTDPEEDKSYPQAIKNVDYKSASAN